MPESNRPLVERIARVLAGAALSSNAEGSDPSAGEKVDLAWREHVNQALAVLHTAREPDEAMPPRAMLACGATWWKPRSRRRSIESARRKREKRRAG